MTPPNQPFSSPRTIENIYFNDIYTFLRSISDGWNVSAYGVRVAAKNTFINGEQLTGDTKLVIPEDYTGRIYISYMKEAHPEWSWDLDEIVFTENTKYIDISNTRIKRIRIPNYISKITQYDDNAIYFSDSKFVEIDLNSIQGVAVNTAFRYNTTLEKVWIKDMQTWLNIVFNGNSSTPFSSSPNAVLYLGNMYTDYTNHPVTIEDVNEGLKEVTEIKQYAFHSMTQLEGKLIIPSSINVLGNACFYSSGIEEVEVKEGITYIPTDMCCSCPNLKIVKLPSTIITMNNKCFWATEKMTTLVIKAITPPTYNTNVLYVKLTAIYVPDESVEVYKTATGWSKHAAKIKPLSEYVES